LADPDSVPDLTKQLTTALRIALGNLQGDIDSAFKAGEDKLAASGVWARLSNEQRSELIGNFHLRPPAREGVGSDDEILVALQSSTLSDRRNLLDAVPQRFSRALSEANRLLEPKARHIVLPGATIHNVTELGKWLAEVRKLVEDQLNEGRTVIL
jgi:hypothetical protein